MFVFFRKNNVFWDHLQDKIFVVTDFFAFCQSENGGGGHTVNEVGYITKEKEVFLGWKGVGGRGG